MVQGTKEENTRRSQRLNKRNGSGTVYAIGPQSLLVRLDTEAHSSAASAGLHLPCKDRTEEWVRPYIHPMELTSMRAVISCNTLHIVAEAQGTHSRPIENDLEVYSEFDCF